MAHIEEKMSEALVEQERQPLSKWIQYLSGAILLSISIYVYYLFHNPNFLPIKKVDFTGAYAHILKKNLEQTVYPYLHSGFFSVNLQGIEKALEKLPWVETAVVHRVWPNKLVISIKEQEPIAIWNDVGFVNAQDQLFFPDKSSLPTNLPRIFAPVSQSAQILALYKQINQELSQFGLVILTMEVSERFTWVLYLNNGMKLMLGNENILPRIKRFIANYVKIFGLRANEVEHVDLRYSNGMAIKWKTSA